MSKTGILATAWFCIGLSFSLAADVKTDFDNKCTACHGFGMAGAPKLGDKESWAPRIARGIELLYENTINGFTGEFGVMPPKGGFTDLSDEQIKEIVDYMVEKGQ